MEETKGWGKHQPTASRALGSELSGVMGNPYLAQDNPGPNVCRKRPLGEDLLDKILQPNCQDEGTGHES